MLYKDRSGKGYSSGSVQYGDGGSAIVIKDTKDFCVSTSHMGVFDTATYDITGSRITGFENGWDGRSDFNYPSLFWDQIDSSSSVDPNTLDLATKALALSNPNSNSISIPNSLLELRELPSLIKSTGSIALAFLKKNVSAKTWASANLAYEFGYSPMVKDLESLAGVSRAVNSTLQNMQGLRRYGKINKKKMLGVYKMFESYNTFLETNRTVLASTVDVESVIQAWGISEWVCEDPSISPLFQDNTNNINHLINAVSGIPRDADTLNAYRAATGTLRYDVSDLWNVMPWSWLVDYFSNIGDLADASNNSLGLKPISLAICKTYTIKKGHNEVISLTTNSKCSAGRMSIVRKTRQPVSISSAQQNIRLFDSFLKPRQLGILASLFVLRRKQGSPSPYMSWAQSLVARL